MVDGQKCTWVLSFELERWLGCMQQRGRKNILLTLGFTRAGFQKLALD